MGAGVGAGVDSRGNAHGGSNSSSSAAAAQSDVVASMATRLKSLEQSTRRMREELVTKDRALFSLKQRNRLLEVGEPGHISITPA